jgi:predicted phosphodiesterase
MRYAVLSDVHANLEALTSVINDLDERRITDVIFLGDAVGYGPNPNECIDLLVGRCSVLIAGNHDRGAIGLADISYFNQNARAAIEWTATALTGKSQKLLRSFPLKREDKDKNVLLVHATPKEPEEWHYLLTLWDAEMNFDYFNQKASFLGHSHQPFIIERAPSGELVTYKETADMRAGSRYIINAGSVGQPRDGDPRACYGIVDGDRVELLRVPYDIESVQNKMKNEHLPYPLIERLSEGR